MLHCDKALLKGANDGYHFTLVFKSVGNDPPAGAYFYWCLQCYVDSISVC